MIYDMHLCWENASLWRSNMNYNLPHYITSSCITVKTHFLSDTKFKLLRWNAMKWCHTCTSQLLIWDRHLRIYENFLLPYSPPPVKSYGVNFLACIPENSSSHTLWKATSGNEISPQYNGNIHYFEKQQSGPTAGTSQWKCLVAWDFFFLFNFLSVKFAYV